MMNRAEKNWPSTEVKCNRCNQMTDELAVFPGGVCLSCWEKKEGRAPLTNADFNGMVNTFRGKGIRKISPTPPIASQH